MTHFFNINSKLCSICGNRAPTKGSTSVSGRFVCAACKVKVSPAEKKPKARSQKDYAAAKREAMKEEVAKIIEIREKKEAQAEQKRIEKIERADMKYAGQLKSAMETLRSSEYKAWYEATTGEDVGEFIQRIENPIGFSIGEFGTMWRQKMCERIEVHASVAASKNPWANPENRRFLAEEVATCRSSKERRYIMQRLATPRWASMQKVLDIYLERDRIIRETGIPHEVDHLVPIVSRVVCGLHCEFNLRVIPKDENRSKSNKYKVE